MNLIPAKTKDPGGAKQFKVGTLVYTKAGLVILFAWLLWADLTFTLMESVPGLIPLKLKALNAPIGLIWLFYDPTPKLVYIVALCLGPISAAVGAIGAASSLPLEMHLFPKARFGQFGSANALVRSIATLFGGFGAGVFMDLMKRLCHGSEFYYRFIPVWWLTFAIIAYVFFILLYRRWKSLNGQRQVRAPATTTLTYSLLGLYTCRSYQDRMWDEVHAVVTDRGLPDFRFI